MTTKPILLNGDCLELMKQIPDNFLDSCVSDPPYGLSKQPDIAEVMQHWLNDKTYEHKSNGFMGKSWDSFVPGPEYWREVYRVLKPGGHAAVFAGSRTQDLMSIALRFAGFEIRETIMWVYGSGMPKSLAVDKAIDKSFGAEREVIGIVDTRGTYDGKVRNSEAINTKWREREGREDTNDLSKKTITAPATDQAKQWQGWGTALKPCYEPIILVRKPLEGTVAQNVLKWGCGGINIDECRVELANEADKSQFEFNHAVGTRLPEEYADKKLGLHEGGWMQQVGEKEMPTGRWPGNFCTDGSDEVVGMFPDAKAGSGNGNAIVGEESNGSIKPIRRGKLIPRTDSGSSARFFYSSKATKKDRGEGNGHPTVKPVKLMEWLVKMITPDNGKCLDPFMGSGTTSLACLNTNRRFIGMELDESYYEIAKSRLTDALGGV